VWESAISHWCGIVLGNQIWVIGLLIAAALPLLWILSVDRGNNGGGGSFVVILHLFFNFSSFEAHAIFSFLSGHVWFYVCSLLILCFFRRMDVMI
jgi:hypothetical protein